MTIRDVFVPLFPSIPFEAQLQVAADIALQIKAHTNVVFTRPDPVITAALVPEMVAVSLTPCRVIETVSVSVPSWLVMVKVSVATSPAPSDCRSALVAV